MAISPQSTLGALVTERPARARVFESLGIDYCCAGKRTLARACESARLDVDEVIRRLESDQAAPAAGHPDPDALSLTDLADHIERAHHAYLREALPRLDQITEKVARVHADRDPRLGDVRRSFCALRDELTSHMLKEERILFPMIRALERGETPPISIADPVRQMEAEHDHAGDALAEMRGATDGFQPPDWACATYRVMLDELAHLEQDMHQHVHEENNVLFPKAIDRQDKLAGAT